MKHLLISALLLISCLMVTGSRGYAGDLFEIVDPLPSENKFTLHINGYAYHFSRDDHNEKNFGVGFSSSFGQMKSDNSLINNGLLAIEADIYKDSFSDVGYAVGLSWQKPFSESWNWGLRAGVGHEDQASENCGMYLIPYIFPFVESHWHSPLNIRVMLVPPFGDLTHG